MARKQVAARIEGDVFQGMFFWLQATDLLWPSSLVERVTIEYDKAAGVDDVAVHYASTGIDAGGRACEADFFQVKYHVDRSADYDSDCLCDPAFSGGKRSLLQRFSDAHAKLKGEYGWFRLHLVSNWQWARGDALAPLLRESEEGALPGRFFSDGPRSRLGKVRTKWRKHLGMTEVDFEDFARRLRFGVDHLGRRGFRDLLSARLARAGLREVPVGQAQNVYDSLSQHFVMNGTNEFNAKSFRAMCEREGLLVQTPTPGSPVIGIRSFMRFAERMEDECQRFVCVADNFDGRHVRDPALWQGAVRSRVKAFLAQPVLRSREHHLMLECHGSLALLAGYELDRKSGARVSPLQKGVNPAAWTPSGAESIKGEWTVATEKAGKKGTDVAIAVSVTRDVLADVREFGGKGSLAFDIVDVRPTSGIGTRSVMNADHALALSDGLADIIRQNHPGRDGVLHLFIAAPNAVLFFLGQHRRALGRVQLYEFDFEGERGGSYTPSIRLPE